MTRQEASLPIAVLDVGYEGMSARGAMVHFDGWEAAKPSGEVTCEVPVAADYVPGEFYRRELPVLLELLATLADVPAIVVVDGYVWLDGGRPGLGAHLWEAQGRRVPVVGVAKNAFVGATPSAEVLRGQSVKPLYVSAAGMALEEAVAGVAAMHGPFRVPTLLRRVDALSRGAE